MDAIKLAYIKQGKIHTKIYSDNWEKDWGTLTRSGLPAFRLSYKDDKRPDRKAFPRDHAAHWVLEETSGPRLQWHRVPDKSWPNWLSQDVDATLEKSDDYRGCRFDFCCEQEVYWIEHRYWYDKNAGLQIQDISILGCNGGIVTWSRFD